MANNQWILVTEEAGELGSQLVSELRRHWNVVFTGRSVDGVNETQANLENPNLDTWVSDPRVMVRMKYVDALSSSLLEQFSPTAMLFIIRTPCHIHQDAEIWRDVLENNVISVMNWHRKLLPAMLMAGSGSIVLMSSITGLKAILAKQLMRRVNQR